MIQNIIIKCPKCGYEYLAGELFLPKHFLGQPTNVTRNDKGEIMFYDGIDMDNEEKYICDNCNTPFHITADIAFNSYYNEEEDFSKDHVTKLKKK